jgi:Uma2 family endonuclease
MAGQVNTLPPIPDSLWRELNAEPDDTVYPDSDGAPLAETPIHVAQIVYLLVALQNHFATDPLVYVGANMFLFWLKGQPDKRVAPDVYLVRGIEPPHNWRSYRVWEHGLAPQVIFEITSRSTRSEDTGFKRELYEQIGVQEYFLFDPLGEYLRPALQGYRLVGERYQPLRLDDKRGLRSEQLGLWMTAREGNLRLLDPVKGRWLLAPNEEFAYRLAAEQRAEQAEAAAQEAEAAAQQAQATAQQAQDAARAAVSRAEEEAAKRAELQAEVARLRAQLGQTGETGRPQS